MIFKNKNSENYEMDYNEYQMRWKEKIAIILLAAFILSIIAFIFYRKRLIMIAIISGFSLLAPKYIEK